MNPQQRYQRVVYRAYHRGTRELDLVMRQLIKPSAETLLEEELVALEEIVELPDTVLEYLLILNRVSPSPAAKEHEQWPFFVQAAMDPLSLQTHRLLTQWRS